MTADTIDTGDAAIDCLVFASVTAATIGIAIVGSYLLNESFRVDAEPSCGFDI